MRLEDIARLIPNYDPWALADDCVFDAKRAERALLFFEHYVKFPEGQKAGQPFELQPWQQAIVVNLYGWYRPDGLRRYREAFIYVPRKNGKTAILAGLTLHEMFCVQEFGAQLYSAAAERDQAALLFRHADQMIRFDEDLAARCKIKPSLKVIERTDGQWSMFKALSSEAGTKHGLSPSFVVVDELHAHKDGELVDVLLTGTGSRSQPLVVYITTADFNRKSICNEKYDYAKCVQANPGDRNQPGFDPAFLPVIYEADFDDDWTSEEVWRKANPNYGVSIRPDYLMRECQKAREVPGYENTFRRLHLNQRTQQDIRAIPMEQWNQCGRDAEPVAWRKEMLERFKGQQCTAGLDLGSTADLTAFVLLFRGEGSEYVVLPWFWCTEAKANQRSRRDGVDYIQWANAGFVRLTDGNETDYETIENDIDDLANQYGIKEIAADRLFQGVSLCQGLMRRGLNVTEFGQGYQSMAAPTRMFLEMVAGGRLLHGNNPVLKWMAGNAATETQLGGGEAVLKFSKRKSTEKIDGIVATCQAIAVDAVGNPVPVLDYYETHDVEFV